MKFRYSSLKLNMTASRNPSVITALNTNINSNNLNNMNNANDETETKYSSPEETKRPTSPTDVVVAALFPDLNPDSPVHGYQLKFHQLRYTKPRARSTYLSNVKTSERSGSSGSTDAGAVTTTRRVIAPSRFVSSSCTRREVSIAENQYKQQDQHQDQSEDQDVSRIFSGLSTTSSSFDSWYNVNPHWSSFRDVDIHAVWCGLPTSAVEVDIRIQVLAQANETKNIFHHTHSAVQEWNLVSAVPDPHALYFRKFDGQRDSSALPKFNQWLSSSTEGDDDNETISPTSTSTPPLYKDTISVTKKRGGLPSGVKSNYLRKRSTRGKQEQALIESSFSISPSADTHPESSPVTVGSTHLSVSPTSNTRFRIHIRAKINLVPSPKGGYCLSIPGLPVPDRGEFPAGLLRLSLPKGETYKEVCLWDDLLKKVVRAEKRTSEVEVGVGGGGEEKEWGVRLFLVEELNKEEKKEEEVVVVAPVAEQEKKNKQWSPWWWCLLFVFLLWISSRAFAHHQVVAVEEGVADWVSRSMSASASGSGAPLADVLTPPLSVIENNEDEGDDNEDEEELVAVVLSTAPGPITFRDHVDWFLGWKGPNGEWEGLYY